MDTDIDQDRLNVSILKLETHFHTGYRARVGRRIGIGIGKVFGQTRSNIHGITATYRAIHEHRVLVDPGSVDALVAGLEQVSTDPVLRNKLGAAGRETIEHKHSFAKRMEKVRTIYDELLARAVET